MRTGIAISRNVPRACLMGAGLAASLVACDSPASPDTSPYPVTLQLSGPGTVPPGATAQFTVRGVYADGSQSDLTNQASWRTGRSTVLTINAAGVATGHALGETSVTVSFTGRVATKSDVIVAPAGTYRLSGNVRDGGVPVVDAEVVVISGPAQGLSTRSAGNYKLYGVVGDSEIRVTKGGYDEAVKRINVSAHQVLDFDLTLINPRDTVAGTYTLSITAAPECASKLPAAFLSRTYKAVITQDGPRLTVKLEGATFFKTGGQSFDHFSGTVEPTRVTFQMQEGFDYYGFLYEFPDLFEEVSQSLLAIGGSAVTTASSGGRSGTLNGSFAIYDGGQRLIQTCRSPDHRFELAR